MPPQMEPKVIKGMSWSHPGSDTKTDAEKLRSQTQNGLQKGPQNGAKSNQNGIPAPKRHNKRGASYQGSPPEPKSHQKASKTQSQSMKNRCKTRRIRPFKSIYLKEKNQAEYFAMRVNAYNCPHILHQLHPMHSKPRPKKRCKTDIMGPCQSIHR